LSTSEAGPSSWALSQDVTESKLAEAALKAREADLRQAYSYLTEAQRLSRTGSFTWDVYADEHNWSEEIRRTFGFDPDVQVTMGMIRAAVHPEDKAEVERVLGGAAEGRDFDLIFRILTREGEVRHAHIVGHRIEHIAGRPVFLGALQDITESKVAEEAANRARSELAHVARVATLNAMTASIAHEVSQPPSGILTNANTCVRMLAADPPNLAGAADTARRTIRDANRATEVIQRLRAMFSTKAPTMEMADLNEVAREVIALSMGELRRNGALLQTDFADKLPHVSVDRVQLQQVILNLLLNAADAMAGVEDRPRTLLVRTGLHDDGSVKLLVRDSGTGIDPATAGRLFDAFYTTKAKGMGVGLSISRSIIARHDGRLWAEANEGPGATFSFCIPSAQSDAG
jgi:PAS domain S-box-containing protein